jgi:hypothetical protein
VPEASIIIHLVATLRAISDELGTRATVAAGRGLSCRSSQAATKSKKDRRVLKRVISEVRALAHPGPSAQILIKRLTAQTRILADRLPLHWNGMHSLLTPSPSSTLDARCSRPQVFRSSPPPPAGHDTFFFERGPYAVRYQYLLLSTLPVIVTSHLRFWKPAISSLFCQLLGLHYTYPPIANTQSETSPL